MLSTSLDAKSINKLIAKNGIDWSLEYTENIIEKFYANLSLIVA